MIRTISITAFIAALIMPASALHAQQQKKVEIKRDTTLCENKDTLISITYVLEDRFDTTSTDKNTERYLNNGLRDNWFFGAEAGVLKYCGEDDNRNGFFSNITPSVRLSAGKWLYPFIGLRANVSYQKAKGFTTGDHGAVSNYIVGDKNSKGLYTQKWSFLNYGADVLFNINDAFKYVPNRKNRFILFAGVEVGNSMKHSNNPEARSSASLDCGFEMRRRVAKNLDFSAAMRMNVYNKSFDDEQTNHFFEYAPAVNVGLVYNLNSKRCRDKTWDTDRNIRIDNYHTCQVVHERHVCSTTVEGKSYIHPVAVFFIINKWDIRPEYRFTLENMAKQIKSSGETFILYGSADSATGNDSINTRLAINRCKSVYDMLVNEFGVNADQLIQKPCGGVDTYATKHLNRCVIIVQDDPQAIKAIRDINEEKRF